MVDSTIALPLGRVMRALGPGIRNSLLAAITTETGRLIVSGAGLHGPAALAAIIVLPAIAVGWFELPTPFALAKGSHLGDLPSPPDRAAGFR